MRHYCKQRQVAGAKAAPASPGDVWIWTAIDENKLIVANYVGNRGQYDANKFMLDLADQIVSCPQLTSDAHWAYEKAVENAFGLGDVDYAQLQKVYGPESTGKGVRSGNTCRAGQIARKTRR